MFGLFNDVKAVIKLDKICIDNNIFRLHYKATFVILLTASILVTAKQYMGEEGMELNFRHKLEEAKIKFHLLNTFMCFKHTFYGFMGCVAKSLSSTAA